MTTAATICNLNDRFRTTFLGGRVNVTAGVAALDEATREAVITQVRQFDRFEPGDDPYGEHDFGAFDHAGERYLWKIDYYARGDFNSGSDNPADPAVTTRVLTIMRADEY